MSKKHTYRTATTWTGNLGKGTSSYIAYLRNFTVSAEGKPDLHGSADPAFRGDAGRWNPEEMLLAAVSPVTNYGTCTCAPTRASALPPTPTTPKR